MSTQDALAPDWFHNRVVTGLQFLWSLGLEGTPAAELSTLTATSWVHAMWDAAGWHEELDAYRIYAGFTTTAARVNRWPTPKQVLEAMPPRHVRPALAGNPTPMPKHVRDFISQRTRRRTDPPGVPTE